MLKIILYRLQKPSTILSLVSQVLSILIILGVHINTAAVTTIAALGCSALVTLGVLSNPDTVNKGYGDDILECSEEGVRTQHVEVNGQMLCKECGAVYIAA